MNAFLLYAFYITFNREFHRVDKFVESGIIGSINNGTAVNNVHYIGKLNLEIYKCVTDDIVTDEVIITDEQIAHIKERHPTVYERYGKYLTEIIENPDYILEANKPNTAFVLKLFNENDDNFQLILRLKTTTDPLEFKNSVITFLKINNRKTEKYLRNKKILYKSSNILDKKE